MKKEDLLQRASKNSENLGKLSDSARENLRRETDWSGSRMGGYDFESAERRLAS